jgi:hypothetical protein
MEILLAMFPHTLVGWGTQIVLSAIGGYIVVSTLEYTFHRFLMHQGLPEWAYKVLPFFRNVRDHHRAHHTIYYKQFDYEPDPIGRDLNLTFGPEHFLLIMLSYLPLLVLSAYLVSLVPVIVFMCIAFAHYFLWNTIHVAMHHGDHPYWSRSRVYKYLARNHYLHHQDTHARFNIVCPFADFVVGTWHGSSENEDRELERLGFAQK